ncbi:DeoR family transcriptional regulator [Xylanimonas allomyrinae]|uniref:DeoR family transcriptional regulator n=1 Tax=Xylanimonas allomyrinae TaxID=2509459 RepID=A0A4P6EHS2_9MICO|nr:substrate-binding domain-containing protein [Xylanimonas allomyrinae]QAY62090.1 DeoR family transcriptional regulator [Xylanimonas allomyrinae]
MVAEGRQDAILRELELHGSMSVTRFAERHSVSPMTVRRDLYRLEKEGLLVRVHGGAISLAVASERARTPERPEAARRSVATIGMIAPSASYYFPAVIRGAEQAARESSFRLVLGTTNYSPVEEVRQVERLLRAGVDGLMITPSSAVGEASPLYRVLLAARVPVVVVERSVTGGRFAGSSIESVRTDHAHGADIAVQHLHGLGHRRIVLAARESPTAPWLQEGWSRAVSRLGESVEGEFRSLPNPTVGTDESVQALRALVERCVAEDVHAVVVHTDVDAVTFVDLAAERGLSVPGDVSVVAYDDEIASLARVPLTAVSPPKWELGYRAARMCFDRIRTTSPGTVVRMTLLPTLVTRESTGPARR